MSNLITIDKEYSKWIDEIVSRYITRLVAMSLLSKTIPGKATSINQKYVAV